MDANNPLTSGEVTAAGLTLFWETFVQPVVNKATGAVSVKVEQRQEDHRWQVAAEAYRESLVRHYGTIRVLGASEETSLEKVFTQVYALDQLTAHRRFNIEALQKAEAEWLRRPEQKGERINGLALVKEGGYGEFPTNYYILGKPGAGKTTFLKYITLQAARHRAINRVPIFVSLHAWARSGSIDLFDFIVSRFDVCHFPDATAFVESLLKEGKALLLFDGLDEVRHEGQQRDQLTEQLQDFVQKYDRCQHLITCRIAASEYAFKGFKTVEVADFTADQIDEYARNWFGSDVETCTFFLQGLKKSDNQGVYL